MGGLTAHLPPSKLSERSRCDLIHRSPQGVWHITPQGRIALLEQQS